MKRSSRSVKVALAAAAIAGCTSAYNAVAAPYLTVSLLGNTTGTGSYFSSVTPTAVGQTLFYEVVVQLAPSTTTNAAAPANFSSIQSFIASDGSDSFGYPTPGSTSGTQTTVDGNGVGLLSSGLSSVAFSLSSGTSGIQPNFSTSQTSGQRMTGQTTSGGQWGAGTGSKGGTITARGNGFNDLDNVVLVRPTYTAGQPVTPTDSNGSAINNSFDGVGNNNPLGATSPTADGVPFGVVIAKGRFIVGALGATNTLNLSFNGMVTSQLVAGIRWENGSTDMNYSVPIGDATNVTDPVIHYNTLTLVGTAVGPTPATIVVTPATGSNLGTGGTVNVANTAAPTADTVTLSSISVTTSTGTQGNGSWGQSGLSTTPIAGGASQTGTATATFGGNVLTGAKLAGTLSFHAAGTTTPASSGEGNYSYNLNAVAAGSPAATGAGTTFGTAQTAAVASGDKVGGLSSTEAGSLGNKLTIVDATAQTADTTVAVAWRHRSTLETWPGATPPLPAGITGLITDVADVDLGASRTTAVVVEMTYDPSLLGGISEAFAFAAGHLYLAHMTTGIDGVNGSADDTWANAGTGLGNLRAYQAGDLATIGTWGVDTTTHQAWAVVPGTIGSQFAVVPEPASLGLLALGALGLIRRRK